MKSESRWWTMNMHTWCLTSKAVQCSFLSSPIFLNCADLARFLLPHWEDMQNYIWELYQASFLLFWSIFTSACHLQCTNCLSKGNVHHHFQFCVSLSLSFCFEATLAPHQAVHQSPYNRMCPSLSSSPFHCSLFSFQFPFPYFPFSLIFTFSFPCLHFPRPLFSLSLSTSFTFFSSCFEATLAPRPKCASISFQ